MGVSRGRRRVPNSRAKDSVPTGQSAGPETALEPGVRFPGTSGARLAVPKVLDGTSDETVSTKTETVPDSFVSRYASHCKLNLCLMSTQKPRQRGGEAGGGVDLAGR
jgi:hypothetical protein